MLSIAIPIYNRDVTKLVHTLLKQCHKSGVPFQILCFDDYSSEKFRQLNRPLGSIIHVNYTEMTENMGRSRIRNWLGKAAFFDYILFLDSDSVIRNKNFIKNYLKHIQPDTLICGGRQYSTSKPRSKKKMLHWKYGVRRESLSPKKRNKDPYMNFHSNNFIVPSAVFQSHFFDEGVEGYGYEDLLYAEDLRENQIKIAHIDNPVLHDGLEIHTEFIKKTENSIKNLALLYTSGKLRKTRLILGYERLRDYNLIPSFKWSYEKLKKKIEDNFQSENPSISLFNLWKLRLFLTEIEKYTSDSVIMKNKKNL
jgi:hypothetical protein